jgi:anti-sigma B factor antagonist
MKLDIKHIDDILLIHVINDSLDASNVADLRRDVLPLLSGERKVLLDMSNLQFVDSAGLGSLLTCLKAVRQYQGEIKLCALTRPVQALFELMRMQKVFHVYATRELALQSF